MQGRSVHLALDITSCECSFSLLYPPSFHPTSSSSSPCLVVSFKNLALLSLSLSLSLCVCVCVCMFVSDVVPLCQLPLRLSPLRSLGARHLQHSQIHCPYRFITAIFPSSKAHEVISHLQTYSTLSAQGDVLTFNPSNRSPHQILFTA